jgi:hypothetical protein
MIERKDRVQILLDDVPEDAAMAASVQISSMETKAIDDVLEFNSTSYDEEVHPCWKRIPHAANEVSSCLASVSITLDDQILHERLTERAKLGKFKAAIGSTNALNSEYLYEDDSETQPLTDDELSDGDDTENESLILDELFESVTKGEIDLDEMMVSAAHAGKPKGIDPATL